MMTDPETILSAGKRIAAIASGRAFKEDTPKGQPEEPSDTDPGKLAAKESGIDPGNPNDINHAGESLTDTLSVGARALAYTSEELPQRHR
jgi:hypothetical protein